MRYLVPPALLGVVLAAPSEVQAGTEGTVGPLAIEAQLSHGGPLGDRFALALSYDRGEWWAAGLGMGAGDFRDHLPPLSLFGRVRLLRLGPLALGLGLSLSRAHREEREISHQVGTFYEYAAVDRVWEPAYRADVIAVLEVMSRAWSLRLETGLGRRLNNPQCRFTGYYAEYTVAPTHGSCDEAPPAYRWDQASNPTLASLTLVVEHRFEPAPAAYDGAPTAPGWKSPELARSLSLYSTLLPSLAGGMLLAATLGYNQHSLAWLGLSTVTLGLAFGPSAGYSYVGEQWRAWGVGALRLLGLGVLAWGVVSYMEDNFCEYCTGSSSATGTAVLGFLALGGTLTSAIYDIVRVPQAARRENARRGLADVAVVPIVLPSPAATGSGLALAGRF